MNWAYIVGTSIAIISCSVSVGIAYGALKQRLVSHEEQDRERFDTVIDLLRNR
jgi:archaellum component FlaF (FlaF/FlaG flagellin family)